MPGERMDAQEALDALAALGPFDSIQKQSWRANNYDRWVELLHPSRTTFVDADGNPVSVDDTRPETLIGAFKVPAKVVVTASRVDDYVAKGYLIPADTPRIEAAPAEPKRTRKGAKATTPDAGAAPEAAPVVDQKTE